MSDPRKQRKHILAVFYDLEKAFTQNGGKVYHSGSIGRAFSGGDL